MKMRIKLKKLTAALFAVMSMNLVIFAAVDLEKQTQMENASLLAYKDTDRSQNGFGTPFSNRTRHCVIVESGIGTEYDVGHFQ